jgi:hypothetical protein
MEKLPARVLALIVACAMVGVGCVDSAITDDVADDGSEEVESLDEAVDETVAEQEATASSCPTPAGVYDPYANGSSGAGTVATYPWRGASSTYPSGNEDFRGYAAATTVECSSAKSKRSHLDVTSGCLTATSVSGDVGGKISTNNFRALALGKTATDDSPVKWTDQRIEYRFYYSSQTGTVGNPGFKAFARYRTENDLYVASWRMDGVVQIQKKHCGVYTALAVLPHHGAPSKNAWHTIRFDAIGDRLVLALDGTQVLSVTSTTFSWGTAGIRIDSASGAYLDDWRVSAP